MGRILPDCFWIILFYYARIRVFTDFKRPVTLFFVCKPGFARHKDFGKVFFYILRPNFLNISLSSEIVVPGIGMSSFIGIESAPLQS